MTEPVCPTCKDTGIVELRHQLYGSRSCPEPYIEIPCPARCAAGVDAEGRELFDTMQRIARGIHV